MARLHSTRFAFVCAVLAGATGASSARAATFDVVREGPDVLTVLDRGAIASAEDGKVRRAWSVTVQRSLAADGPQQPGYVRTLYDYDCGARTLRWRSLFAYSRFGDLLVHKDNSDPAWAPIAGNWEAVAAARIVCDGQMSSSVYAASSIGDLVLAQMRAWDAAAPMPDLQPVLPPRKPTKKSASKHRDKSAHQR